MELIAQIELDKHLTKHKHYRVLDSTDKEYTVINNSGVRYSYPKRCFAQTFKMSESNLAENNNPALIKVKNPFPIGHYLYKECSDIEKSFDKCRKIKSLESKSSNPIEEKFKEAAQVRSEINNGGSTDYYKIDPKWKMCQDIIETRKMNYSQGNIFKAAFTFNVGRHKGTDELREINKIIYFAERIRNEILKERENG